MNRIRENQPWLGKHLNANSGELLPPLFVKGERTSVTRNGGSRGCSCRRQPADQRCDLCLGMQPAHGNTAEMEPGPNAPPFSLS